MDLTELAAARIATSVQNGETTAEAVALAHFARIDRMDGTVKAFLAVIKDRALEQARAVDAKRKKGAALGALAGVPVALKDNIQLKGVETTCGSRILKGHIAAYDATVTERLKAADAVIVGKTNLDEFAMGSSTENSAFQKTTNPWDPACVPGGSSGGSAAAAAARMCAFSLGSDTGGSIRQPAAFCGVVGLKPTYGLVSRYGLVAFASSLDQIGPFTRTVEDAELALSVIGGHDPKDTTSALDAPAAPAPAPKDLKGLRIGLPKEYFIEGLDPEIEKSVRDAVEVLKSLGASLQEVSLPHTKYAVAAYYIIAPSEASSNLARFDGIRYGFVERSASSLQEVYEMSRGAGFGPEVKRRIMLGTYALSSGYYDAYYSKAQRVRTLMANDFKEAFKQVDLIAAPTTPTPPFRFGEKTNDPIAMYLSDVFTIPSNMAGNASVSIPCGLSKTGLPLGLQLIGNVFQEKQMLSVAKAYEAAKPFALLKA
ncbi:MAG: Asp-tRNA(Asn)/Glu-tRNA(Gln) amidotransferase GatCAB subunit A [Elusimicrobia bacterium CG11_big_fil_rev_8_21_14_0_20_64_6]|nr:MAG: Asp-tRNA(Asn)/Glu-tRNA(Gln) amidotransferase GatCAB subunit A [Elusimicrobia bacterium CG11_big_fil_rev_8_21_14_0_20_64_6]